jgi:HK97 family phage major capsid protein
MELERKMTELHEAFAEFKKQNDARIKEIETKGSTTGERIAKIDSLNETISRIEGEMKSIQTSMNRTGGFDASAQNPQSEKEEKALAAFNKYLRKGLETPELKAMSVDSDEDGGFLVTSAMSSEIVKKVFESSPVRQVASVQTISTDALEILQDLDELESGWVGETQVRNETQTPKLKKIVIPVHELYAQPKATQKLLDDAAVNVESWLAEKVAEKFARDEATAFVKGDGTAKPMGFLSYPTGTGYGQIEQVETAGSLAITGDDLIELSYSLKEAYKNGAAWMAKRQIIKEFRKFKDLQGRYLWEPGLNGSTQSTLLGFPIYEANDMGDKVAAGLPVAFGNFRQGYQIVDRIGIRVIRDIFTAKPHVLFYTTKRVGGAVKNFEAIKLLKVKA